MSQTIGPAVRERNVAGQPAEAGDQRPTVGLELENDHGRIILQYNPFDSDVFERRIGRIVEAEAPSTVAHIALLEELVAGARAMGFDQLLRRTMASAHNEIWALGRTGFELLDVGVMFARRTDGAGPAPARNDIVVRTATDADVEALAEGLLALPWGSRYEVDPSYPAHQIRELRRRWLWNSHRGRADRVLVGEIEGRAGAFATCVLDARERVGDIELVGTLPEFRGRGAASHLVAHAVAWFSGQAEIVTVRTQATNTVAARVYEKAGFNLDSCDLTFRLSLEGTVTQP